MKRFIVSLLVVMTLIIILIQPQTTNALLALFFLGVIPGTNERIPFWLMLVILVLGAFLLIRWLNSQPLYIGGIARQEQTARKIARRKVAKKVHKTSITTRKKRQTKSTKKQSIRRLA